MDLQNHWYGHSAILAKETGQRRVRHMPALLQHGWAASSPVASMFSAFPNVSTEASNRNMLVWSHDSRAWSPEGESHRTVPIGAPFLYLLRMRTDEHVGEKVPLIAPQHTTRERAAEVDTAELANYYLKEYGPSRVCLHGDDLAIPEIVAAWRQAGHTVVSAGTRWDPLSLARQVDGLRGTSRLVTNRLSTMVFYALAIGVPVTIEGSVATFAGESDATVASLVARWPEIHHPDAPLAEQQEVALRELGADFMREPGELAELVGWGRRGGAAGAGLDYWVTSPVRHALMVFGITERIQYEATAKETGHAVERASKASVFLKNPLSHMSKRLPAMPDLAAPAPWLQPE